MDLLTIEQTTFCYEDVLIQLSSLQGLYGLTNRELTVLCALISHEVNEGRTLGNSSTKALAEFLGVSEKTIKTHISNLFSKVLRDSDVTSRTLLANKALNHLVGETTVTLLEA